MLECIYSEPSEIDRKGPEKHMEVPAQPAFEFLSYLFGVRVQNSWTVIVLALVTLAAFYFFLCFCAWVWNRHCNSFEKQHRLEIQYRGNQGRYVCNDPHQDSSRCNFSYARYSEKCFT